MLSYDELTDEQRNAVTKTLMEYLLPRQVFDGVDAVDEVHAPIMPGVVRYNYQGCLWASFPDSPGQWFICRDTAAEPEDDVIAFQVVLNPDGRVMGNASGILFLSPHKGRWFAHVANIGNNREAEIDFSEEGDRKWRSNPWPVK